jgi:Ca-activated chloride channel family protein
MSSLWGDIHFQNPVFFLLLLAIPLFLFWKWYKKPARSANFTISDLHGLGASSSLRSRLRILIPIARAIAYSLLVIALARPQLTLKEEEVKAEGIDIMLIMDLSSSMLAKDFEPDRLSVSKQVAQTFVDKRQYDRIGLAVFAGESFTQCPITTDHRILKTFLANLECGMLEDGTAIGMGLASAVNRLKESDGTSKVAILLTDGVNNAGYIKPMTAAEIAKEIGVKVYTIGVGTLGNAISPVSRRSDGRYVFGMAKVEIDEKLLEEIAKSTGGKYFRATSEAKLEQIYEEIDRLEKTEIDVTVFKRYSEEFRKFLFWGIILLLIEFILNHVLLRKIP